MKGYMKENGKWGDLLDESPAETRLTVYRRINTAKRARVWPIGSAFLKSCKISEIQRSCGH